MLKTTLGTSFTPGVNQKGKAVGANWSFFLPTLEMKAILVLGAPSTATLKVIAHLADQIIVLWRTPSQAQKLEESQQKLGLSNLTLLPFSPTAKLALPVATIDLVLVTDRRSVQWLQQTPTLWRELTTRLSPTGIIYYEYRGRRDPLQHIWRGDATITTADQAAGVTQTFWLTPVQGEMQTAVPLADRETISYALEHSLYRSSVDLNTWKKLAQRRKGPPQTARARQPAVKAMRPTPARSRNSLRRRLNTTAKRLLIQSTKMMERVEKAIYQLPWLGSFLQRQGVLLHTAPTLAGQPPAYLCALAQTVGITLDHYRWLLSARGEYSSRKVLFFLFAPGAQAPTYIVKMTRDAALNARVENEYQALVQLYALGIGQPDILPKPLFLGHHAQLAVVGESIIDGTSFSKHTQRNAHCPALHAAVDFFVTLGAATKDTTNASPQKVAQVLQTLFTRFNAIYQLSPAHHAFLTDQLEQVRLCSQPFPLVFQHGDPGPWNMLVTPRGRIAVLDWEAAEPQGMPLWDLFYFLRSYCVDVARGQGVNDVLRGFQTQFMAATPMGDFVVDTVQHYCTQIGLPATVVKPLFYTCWMHRALKEATRLPVDKVERGRFVTLLRLCIDNPEAPTLQRLGAGMPPKDLSDKVQLQVASEAW